MSAAPRIEVRGEPSYLSSPSAGGLQIAIHVVLDRTGALDATQVVFDDDHIENVERFVASRKKLRLDFERMRKSRMYLAPMPGDYVASRIHAAIARHRANGHAFTRAMEMYLPKVPAPAVTPPHPAEALSPVRDAPLRVLGSVGLLFEHELSMFVPGEAAVRGYLTQVQAIPSGTQEENVERLTKLTHEYVDAWFTPERRALFATQLLDAAAVFLSNRRPELCLDAVATADAVRDASPLLDKHPHEITMLMMYFQKLLVMQRASSELRDG